MRLVTDLYLWYKPGEELSDDVLHSLGALMDASQQSCSALYECSCAELDELTRSAAMRVRTAVDSQVRRPAQYPAFSR